MTSPAMPTLDDLLTKTSRTFALTIPLLPRPVREEVTTAYLLFRIADTFEDAHVWSIRRRIAALDALGRLLRDPDPADVLAARAAWSEQPPSAHAGYAELLNETPFVFERYRALREPARDVVREHVLRTNSGMAAFVARSDGQGRLQLRDVEDLRAYCYVVAGIVGEMLTELFVIDQPALAPRAADLRRRARHFGEGLQLVNIVKDAADDASEGRRFLPAEADRSAIFALARRSLAHAGHYVEHLRAAGVPRGMIAFNSLPALLAWATLDTVEREGPGAKISRDEVFDIIAAMNGALDRNEPVLPLLPEATH